MRMRQLGSGQSLVFVVSAEIRRKITAARRMPPTGEIRVVDVLCWSVRETWQELRRLMPLWAAQGRRHLHHERLWERVRLGLSSGSGLGAGPDVEDGFLEREALTLGERYGLSDEGRAAWETGGPGETQIRKRCEDFAVGSSAGDGFGGEQERELSTEAEEDRLVARSEPQRPYEPSLHKDVEAFIATGMVTSGSKAFLPAFESLASSSMGSSLSCLRLPSNLLVTADFARTVHLPTPAGVSDAYLRPVQWIATAPSSSGPASTIVILSPWEANELLPIIRSGTATATLHLFAPRTSLGTRSLEDLTLFTTPPLPPGWSAARPAVMLLVLFAGQLYLYSYADYAEICRFLGGAGRISRGQDGGEGDREVEICDENGASSAASRTLLLVSRIRHQNRDVSKTDVGRMLDGDVLQPEMFSSRIRLPRLENS